MAYESSVPYRAGTERYTSFRIPAVVRARSGAVPALAEGRVSSAAARHRADAVSADGGESLLTPFRPPAGLAGLACQGSLLHLDDHPTARALMTLRASRDAGPTWTTAHPTDGLPAACSDRTCGRAELRFRFAAAQLSRSAVRPDRDTAGLLYETGDFSAYSTITFRRIPVEEPA
ncbi:hypothetical protein [Streptomyces sp. N2A]|uniref:hypothetical protein n=1 Tax=Streptomyces sp. N2A TaxID=3073936 RepID=UPI0037DA35D4